MLMAGKISGVSAAPAEGSGAGSLVVWSVSMRVTMDTWGELSNKRFSAQSRLEFYTFWHLHGHGKTRKSLRL